MKYKVGDKTLLGEIDTVQKGFERPYRAFTNGQCWFTESEIDAIIVKPKRNIDHFIELWERGQTKEAIVFFNETRDLGFRTDRTNGKIVGICTALFQPYVEPSRYPKLTPEELRSVKWLVEGGYNKLYRGCIRAIENLVVACGTTSKDVCSLSVGDVPVGDALKYSKWITESPINLRELLAAQEG